VPVQKAPSPEPFSVHQQHAARRLCGCEQSSSQPTTKQSRKRANSQLQSQAASIHT
jgi:hypothetical protein